MPRDVLSRAEYLDRWQELHGGYDPRGSRLVGPWLSTVYVVARPLARAGAAPDLVTLSGALVSAVVVGIVSLQGRWLVLAAVVVGLSGLLDSVDGAAAVLQGRTTTFGAVLDSVVDRVSDVLYLVAFAVAGAPAWVCIAAGAVVLVQEYARARATAVGMDDIGVVTVGERPTRVIVVAMFLLAAGVYPSEAHFWVTAGAAVSLAVGIVALLQLLVVVRRRLR
jgi:phosphatidylglycerophosphate synthase